ncbi:MAG: tRNA lysidine(34) synthetase TilS [Henriciella sp.]
MRFGADFDALIERFSPDNSRPIAIAVSGGSDSIALLCLADDWARRAGRKLIALTVDHQLRPEAKTEAAWVARVCAGLGHPHKTLKWTAPRPSQAAARLARYELLAQTARAYGASCLLAGHTFDDVVETAMIRRRRGIRDATIAGPVLAAPLPVWPSGRSVTLLRPLIQTTRSDLQTFLKTRHQGWVDDPANANPAYERVRVRQFFSRHPRLAALAKAFVREQQNRRAAQQHALAEEMARVTVDPSGLIDTGAAKISPTLLRLLIRCASGSAHDARDGAVRDLITALSAPGQRQTLGGAWVQRTKTGFLIGRDPAHDAGAEDTDLFDGRFERDPAETQPPSKDLPFLVRQSAPPGPNWREIISERLVHLITCYQTPFLESVQRALEHEKQLVDLQ